MRRWHLPSLEPTSRKETPRTPGAGAPRVPSDGRQIPRVLFSDPECRVVVIDLLAGEELGDHQVRQRAVVEVVAGSVSITCGGETVVCETGTLVTFEPGEHHALRALADARLLLLLAPWAGAAFDPQAASALDMHLPANATVSPLGD